MSQATRFALDFNGVRRVFAPDDTLPEGLRTGAILQARLVDELTQQPVAGPASVQVAGDAFKRAGARSAVNPRAAVGGIVGLVGTAAHALPALGSTAYEVGVRARAPGYIAARRTMSFGPVAGFPASFQPAALGDIAMHREPVLLYGRANLRTAASFTPLPNATVGVSGLWRQVPTPTLSPPPAAADIVVVDPVLYADRPAGATLTLTSLTPQAADEKRLLRPLPAGATEVALSNRTALPVNGLLGIDVADPERAEWVRVLAVSGGSNAADAAVATLAFPLARAHAAGALAHPVTVVLLAPTQILSLDAMAGDTTLLLGGLGGMTTSAVQITGGPAPAEYHRLALYTTVTDIDGQWRLPPLSRVAQLTLAATHPGFTSPPRTLAVEYPRREQRVDLVFT